MTARQRRDSRRVAVNRCDGNRTFSFINTFGPGCPGCINCDPSGSGIREQAKAGNPCAKELLAREGRS